jgi:hypothetical protein
MSSNVLMISPKVVKDRTQLHTNVDDKLIVSEIKVAQDMFILPLLGSKLYNKILTDIAATNLVGEYLILRDSYLYDCLTWLTLHELVTTINGQMWNTGVSNPTASNSTQADAKEIEALRSKYKARAEHYTERARLYLLQNAATKFPEFLNVSGGIDVVAPHGNTYTCPIYLGDTPQYVDGGYSDNRHTPQPNRFNNENY